MLILVDSHTVFVFYDGLIDGDLIDGNLINKVLMDDDLIDGLCLTCRWALQDIEKILDVRDIAAVPPANAEGGKQEAAAAAAVGPGSASAVAGGGVKAAGKEYYVKWKEASYLHCRSGLAHLEMALHCRAHVCWGI